MSRCDPARRCVHASWSLLIIFLIGSLLSHTLRPVPEFDHACLSFAFFFGSALEIEDARASPGCSAHDSYDADAESEASEFDHASLLVLCDGFVVELGFNECEDAPVPDEEVGHAALGAQVAEVFEPLGVVCSYDFLEPVILLLDRRIPFFSVRVDESSSPDDVSASFVVCACDPLCVSAYACWSAVAQDPVALDSHGTPIDADPLNLRWQMSYGS